MSEQAIKVVAQQLWASWVLLAGGASQADSMDRVKRNSGKVFKLLAQLAAPSEMAKFILPVTVAEAQAIAARMPGNKKLATLQGEALLAEVCRMRSAKKSENVQAIIAVLKDYSINLSATDAGKTLATTFGIKAEETLTKVMVLLALEGVTAVGAKELNTFAPANVIFNDKKVTKFCKNLETLAVTKEVVVFDRTYTQANHDNLQMVICKLARKFK
jgi:hypothetical protein